MYKFTHEYSDDEQGISNTKIEHSTDQKDITYEDLVKMFRDFSIGCGFHPDTVEEYLDVE